MTRAHLMQGPEQYPNLVRRFLPSSEIPPFPKSGVPMEPIWAGRIGPMHPDLRQFVNEPRVRFSEDANKVHYEPQHSPTPSADAPEDDEKHSPVQESKPDSPIPDEKGKSHEDIGVQVGDIQPESRHGRASYPPSEAAAFPNPGPISQSTLPYTSFARPPSPYRNAVPVCRCVLKLRKSPHFIRWICMVPDRRGRYPTRPKT